MARKNRKEIGQVQSPDGTLEDVLGIKYVSFADCNSAKII